MTSFETLALQTCAILAGSLVGSVLPLLRRVPRSDIGLSFSAGVMLGASFFHMLPEAIEEGGASAVPFVLVGFLLLFLLERFALVHVCAEPGVHAHAGLAAAGPAPIPHGEPGHVHAAGEGTGCEVHTLGLAAWLGMSAHTIVDGFALGAASVQPELGLLVFIAILAHKVPNAFSLATILRAEGYSRWKALGMNATFALMVPVGVGLYLALRQVVHVETFTAYALAASAGTFLHLSVSDILPDLHRRGGSRWVLSAALLGGLAVMGALKLSGIGH